MKYYVTRQCYLDFTGNYIHFTDGTHAKLLRAHLPTRHLFASNAMCTFGKPLAWYLCPKDVVNEPLSRS